MSDLLVLRGRRWRLLALADVSCDRLVAVADRQRAGKISRCGRSERSPLGGRYACSRRSTVLRA